MSHARFVMSAAKVEQLPELSEVEVAFVGRSNVGKSSLVGAILGRPGMVRTSRTPGRTQLLNLFLLDGILAVVDLPGYGYAKLSKSDRAAMDARVGGYVRDRSGLAGVVMVLDARREKVSELDRDMAALLLNSERPVLVAVTKIDTVPKNRRLGRIRQIEKDLGVPQGAAVAVSSKTGEGREELWDRLMELREPMAPAEADE